MLTNLESNFEELIKKQNIQDFDIRKKLLKKFIKEGFPDKNTEDWKFSDFNKIINLKFPNLNINFGLDKKKLLIKNQILNNFEHNKIILANGELIEIDLSFENKDEVQIAQFDKRNDFQINKNTLLDLNEALSLKYLDIKISNNYKFKKPLVIYHLRNESLNSKIINLNINFTLGENSSLCLVNNFNDDNESNFINLKYNFELSKDSNLKNYLVDGQNNNNARYLFININQKKNSNSENFIFSKGSNFFKTEIFSNLYGEYSSSFINGIIYLENEKHHEIKTNINHLSANTKSYQLIKNVLKDKSRGIYQGKIFVDQIAQKTDGYQLSKTLLLDKSTEFNGKPELEIYADDVKCSHGSTSGNLDEEAIYYLMSRGISYDQSKKLLIDGFLLEVLNKITDENIKKYLTNLIN